MALTITENETLEPTQTVNVASGVTFDTQSNTDVGTSSELIATFNVIGKNTLKVEVQVTVQDLNSFVIKARGSSGGSYEQLYSTSGDYTSPNGFLEFTNQFTTATGVTTADDDLTTTAAGESASFRMDVAGFDSIQIWASCGTTGGTTTTEGVAY